MTMENDLVERLLAKAEFLGGAHFERNREVVVMPVDEEDVFLASLYMAEAGARIKALESELAAAIIEVSNQARLRGEAEGKLHVSELAGIVEGWQLRAERAEAELVRKTEALDKLLRAAVAVNRRGATTGYQWVDLGSVIVAARSALEEKTDV